MVIICDIFCLIEINLDKMLAHQKDKCKNYLQNFSVILLNTCDTVTIDNVQIVNSSETQLHKAIFCVYLFYDAYVVDKIIAIMI